MIKTNIILNNKVWYRYLKNPNELIQKKIKKFNKKFTLYKNKIIFFTILLSGNGEIKKLNKKYRKKNKSTDILSFPFYSKKELKIKLKKDDEIYLGDIIVNINKINGKKNKLNFISEFDKLWMHGLVHLFGYDHKKDNDYYTMRKVEKKFLSYLN